MLLYRELSHKEKTRKSISLSLFFVVALSLFAINTFLASKTHQMWYILLGSFVSMYLYVNFATVALQLILGDPGYVNLETELLYTEEPTDEETYRIVHRIHHCSVCMKDVYGYNHHCRTIEQCVSRDSLPYFFKFFCSICLVLLFEIIEGAIGLLLLSTIEQRVWLIFSAAVLPCVVFLSSVLLYQPVCRDLLAVEMLRGETPKECSILENMRNTLGARWLAALFIPFAEMISLNREIAMPVIQADGNEHSE